ncbi:hypothetical protein Peur_029524 [Populus x canadensis]
MKLQMLLNKCPMRHGITLDQCHSLYLYFFEKGNPHITGAAIQSLIELITTEMQSDNSTPDPAADAFLPRALGYIQFQKQKGGAIGEKYDPIKV